MDITAAHTMLMRVLRIFERSRFGLLERVIRPDDVFVDVGANRGDFTVWAASKVSRVFAYEPVPESVRSLRRTISLNGLDNVTVRPVAAFDRSGTQILHVKGGWSTLKESSAFTPYRDQAVETTAREPTT